MKKVISSVLTLVLVLAMAVPVMANPFNDVPTDHWAYDAIKKAAEAGLLEGYGDGSYKPGQALSRYELAALAGRVIDEVEAGDNQVSAEVVKAISNVAEEFDAELAEINEKLAGSNALTFSGKTGVEYENTKVNGEGDAYIDPFNQDVDGDDDVDADDMITADEYFKHFADVNVNIEKDGVVADLDMKTVANHFGDTDESNLELDSISGSISNEDFLATIGDDQGLEWTDYLYNGSEDIDGVIFNAGDTQIVLGQDDTTRDIALKQDNLFDLPINVFAGIEDEADRNVVVGADTEFNLAGVDFSGEVAANDTELAGRLARIGASKDFGLVALEGNYENTENFMGIEEDEDFLGDKKGYDVKATTNVDKVELAAKYEDYNNTDETTLSAAVNEDNSYDVYGVEVFGNYEYKLNSQDELRYVEANKELGDITLAGIYDFDNTENKSDKVLSAAYVTELDLAGIKLTPKAKVAAIYDIDNNQALNTEAGVDANYAVNDKLALNGGYSWADKEARVDTAGEFIVAQAGLEYKVTEDTAATINLEDTNFVGNNTDDSFDTQSIAGQVSVNF